MKKACRFLIIPFILIFITIFNVGKEKKASVEDVDMAIAAGIDIESNNELSVPICVYIFRENKVKSDIRIGKALSIGKTREDRQIRSDKEFSFGGERIFVFSEDYCRYGIKSEMNILFNNPQIFGTPYCMVCEGKAADILKLNIEGYNSSVDFMEGLMRNTMKYNFFTDSYKLIDIFVRVDSEGRNISLPFVEIKDNKVEVTGMALFKADKMIAKISIDEAKWMNMIYPESGQGILTIQNTTNEYVDVIAKAKKKVKCYKEDGKYKFVINIDIAADRISDEMYKDKLLFSSPDAYKELESKLGSLVKKNCYVFLDKMQNDYKVDCFELGRVAAAKYGRDSGIDWNEEISKSDINVNVKVNLDKLGRGGG